MKVFIDHPLIQKITAGIIDGEALEKACADAKILKEGEEIEVLLDWTSLFELLGLGSLFKDFPPLVDGHPMFQHFLSILDENDPNVWTHLFDQLFAICLADVKNMKEIDQAFLLSKIHEKQQTASLVFAKALKYYERLLLDAPYHTIHDLTLYLSFDRVSVCLSLFFEYITTGKNLLAGLKILRDCLVESFQHITLQGRTLPSFFRFIEALYAFEMKDENLDNHTEEEWLELCKSSRALRERDELIDVKYIDHGLTRDGVVVVTTDSDEVVNLSQTLARLMIQKLKQEDLNWSFNLKPVQVVLLRIDRE